MNKINRRLIIAGGAFALAGCAEQSKFRTYEGPEVTSLVLFKGQRQLYLLNNNTTLKSYAFELGSNPMGHKQYEGDGRTPEGQYWVNRRNPNSQYYLSVGISYPNQRDVEVARAMGRSPGRDIFIHGTPREFRGEQDWTAGCVAITNHQIEDVYAMVRDGTPVFINA